MFYASSLYGDTEYGLFVVFVLNMNVQLFTLTRTLLWLKILMIFSNVESSVLI